MPAVTKDRLVEPNEFGDYWLEVPTEAPAILPSKRMKKNEVVESGRYIVLLNGTGVVFDGPVIRLFTLKDAFTYVRSLEPSYRNVKAVRE